MRILMLCERMEREGAETHVLTLSCTLARMLYYNVDLDAEIPQELYQMTAEVLAYVYQLKNK